MHVMTSGLGLSLALWLVQSTMVPVGPVDLPAVQTASSPAASGTLPIRTQAQWQQWLQATANRPSPLDRLPAGARKRFIASLSFGHSGLQGMDLNELKLSLNDAGIAAVLALFGPPWTEIPVKSQMRRGSTPTTPDTISDLEQRYNRLYAEFTQNARLDAVGRAGRSTLPARFELLLPEARDEAAMQALDSHDLFLLQRASQDLAKRSHDLPDAVQHSVVAAQQAVFDQAFRRGIANTEDANALRQSLLNMRDFSAAQALGKRIPQLAALPRFVDQAPHPRGQPTVWRMSSDGSTLTRSAIDLRGDHLLVTAGCHFSEDAATDISADPLLAPVFAKHAQWLVLQPGQEDLALVKQWNRRFPKAQVAMIHSPQEWSLFPNWAMPTFYLVRDAKVIGTSSGWSRGDSAERAGLMALIRQAGWLAGNGQATRSTVAAGAISR